MERNRIYLKFLNVNFSTTVHNLAGSAADYQHGRPAGNVAFTGAVIQGGQLNISIRSLNQSPTLATPETGGDKIHKKVQKTKVYIYIYSKKRFASLLKAYSIFRNSSIVKRKPKFLWMGLVIFFVEWTLLKVQFGLFNHTGIQHWFSLREGAFFPGGGGGEWGLRGDEMKD